MRCAVAQAVLPGNSAHNSRHLSIAIKNRSFTLLDPCVMLMVDSISPSWSPPARWRARVWRPRRGPDQRRPWARVRRTSGVRKSTRGGTARIIGHLSVGYGTVVSGNAHAGEPRAQKRTPGSGSVAMFAFALRSVSVKRRRAPRNSPTPGDYLTPPKYRRACA